MLLTALSLLLAGCGLTFTAPVPVAKTVYLAVDQAVMDACGSVTLSGGFFPVPTTPLPGSPQPYHLGLKVDGALVTPPEPGELLMDASGITLRRPGTLVFRTALADTSVYTTTATCAKANESLPLSFTAHIVVATPGVAPVVLRLNRAVSGSWSVATKEYPVGTPDGHLDLP